MNIQKRGRTWAYCLLLFACLVPQAALAYEPKAYGVGGFMNIDGEIHKADRIIRCEGNIDHIDIGLGRLSGRQGFHLSTATAFDFAERVPIFFTRQELGTFLSTERHKDFLVVEFDKAVKGYAKDRNLLAEFKPFLDTLGYKRVLIVGDSAWGAEVIADYQRDLKEEEEQKRAYLKALEQHVNEISK